MKSVSPLVAPLLASVLIALPVAHAQEKAGVVVAGTVETIVTVVDVDREARVVTVMGPKGGLTAINVPPEAQNLDQVQPGAHFKVEYLQSVVLALSKGAGSATTSESKSVRLAPKGGTPGGSIVHTREINAVVEKIDRDNRTVTVRGTEGGPLDLQIDEAVKAFDQIETGDIITVQYTEGLAMRMIRQ
jgi:hypothetical protein